MRQEEFIRRTTAHAALRYAIIASGWAFLGIYLLSEYHDYGSYFITHLFSAENLSADIFHRAILLAPVMSTFVGYVMKKRDIAEQTAQKAEGELRSIYNAISGHLTVVDTDYRILSYNETVERQFGGGLEGRLCYEAFQARDGVCPDCAVKQTIETKKPAYTFQPATSSSKPVDIYTYPIFDDKGEVSAVVEHGTEVGETLELQDNFNRQRVLLNTVFETTPDVMYIKDKEGKYLMVNKAFEEFMDISRDEAVGKTLKDILPGELARESRASDRGVLEGETYHKEQRAVKDGKEFIFDTIKMPLRDDDGAVYGIVGVSHNVTESKLAEESLQILLKAVESLIVGVTISDASGKIIYTNPAEAEMHGYDVEELVGKDVNCLAPPELRNSIDLTDRRGPFSRESLNLRKDGSVFPVHLTSVGVEDDDGVPFAIITVCEDITERKRAEEVLRAAKVMAEEERAKTEAIIACIGDGISIHDRDFKILYQNEAHEGMLGRHVGEHCYEAYQGKDHVCEGCPLAKAFDDGGIHVAERSVAANDGLLHVFMTASPLRDSEGNIVAGIEVVKNITERKLAEEELAYNQLFLKSIIENEPECVKLLDAEGTLIDMNASGLRMIGADSLDQVRGQNMYGLVAPEHREAFKAHVERVCQGEKSMLEFRAVGLKGKSIWLETHAVPFHDAREKRTLLLAVTRDVTERRRAEDEIREINTRLQTLVDSIPGMVFFKDAEGRHLVVNRACVEMIGLEEEEIVGKTADEVLPPEVAESCNKGDEAVIQAGRTVRVEEDTGGKVLETIKAPLFDDSGNYKGIVGLSFDVTERRRAADALKESEERYRGLFDSARDAIFIADAESGVIVNANREAERLLGRPASEIIGMHQSELHPEEERQLYTAAFTRAIREQSAISRKPGIDIYVVDKEGRKIPVEISANVIEIEGRKLLQGIFRDITGRRAAERAAREGKQYLENVLNSIQDGLCIIARDFTIVLANPTIEKWYAHRSPVVGGKCYEVFRGRTEVCDPCPCAEARNKGESCFDVVNYYGPEGRSGTLELYGFPLSDSSTGEVTGMIHYYRDITDRVALQAEAFRAAQLASVGELAAGVAHEINNPINGIINYAQLLINKLPEGSEENSISRRIIKEGDRISGIVGALLTFTRDNGLMEEPVLIEELVSEALSLTISQLAKDGISVRTNISADMPRVNVKRQHLEQVFLNLINNARHALNAKYPDGHPEKALEILGESMTAEDIPHVRISFTDRGTGIAADIIDRVTEPFFTTKQKGSGTGLGLSISSSIIKNIGGTLFIESVDGEYTKVTIELPIGVAQ